MRAFATLVALALTTTAQAQTVANGNFEAGDLTSWTDVSSGMCGGIAGGFCEDGEAFVLSEADAGFPLAGDYALFLYTGDQAGWQPTFGSVESSPFLVTRSHLGWDQASEEPVQLELTLFDANGSEVGTLEPAPSLNGPMAQQIEVAPACGRSLTVVVRAQPAEIPGDWEPVVGTSVFDGFRLEGTPCAQFTDSDGDGFCDNGIDTNGDGDCASAGEPTLDVQDCDDNAFGVNPDATEINGNGIDEDCDGVDGAGTGGGSGGGAGTGGSGTGAGTGTGGGTATGVGTGTGNTTPNEVNPRGENDEIKASGAGCGCDSTRAPMTGLWLVALALIGLRRRE